MDTQIVVEMPTEEQVDLAVDTLKLLADGTRLRILWVLLHGEHSVSRLADHIAQDLPDHAVRKPRKAPQSGRTA